ncbi:leucyl/phenylalanyl-tRNA--protein transferase [Hahella ganghwensis]|uniref:leucyl/phenylalanyl-tRNA--protein transferase n=1 Tax=Hahella ganghwensis TaxID=286420 RepID=UPI00047653E2|nr:leucyl/phenylalanyl-tRNA--protein transferase [Hahella ganghwensis]
MTELAWLDREIMFPHPSTALEDPNGLLCMGGDLSPERLLRAYRMGIFPWFSDDQPILWWSPDPRCTLEFNNLHISRSMRRTFNSQRFQFSFDTSFESVIQACAEPRSYCSDTWITHDMQLAYIYLARLGFAHCIEVWEGENLVGGLYGIAMGRCFFGESMFSRQTNASKAAFIVLAKHLEAWGYSLFDCQVPNPHLLSLGATSTPRDKFLTILAENIDHNLSHEWLIDRNLI